MVYGLNSRSVFCSRLHSSNSWERGWCVCPPIRDWTHWIRLWLKQTAAASLHLQKGTAGSDNVLEKDCTVFVLRRLLNWADWSAPPPDDTAFIKELFKGLPFSICYLYMRTCIPGLCGAFQVVCQINHKPLLATTGFSHQFNTQQSSPAPENVRRSSSVSFFYTQTCFVHSCTLCMPYSCRQLFQKMQKFHFDTLPL